MVLPNFHCCCRASLWLLASNQLSSRYLDKYLLMEQKVRKVAAACCNDIVFLCIFT